MVNDSGAGVQLAVGLITAGVADATGDGGCLDEFLEPLTAPELCAMFVGLGSIAGLAIRAYADAVEITFEEALRAFAIQAVTGALE